MDKKSLALLLVASSFASSTFATSIIDKVLSKNKSTIPSIVKTHNVAQKTSQQPYTDFSGTWSINCGNGPGGTTVIDNDADYISFDGDVSRIGKGLQSQSDANEEFTAFEHMSYEWNADGSALITKGIALIKDSTNRSAIETGISKFSMNMKNGQIYLNGKFSMFADMRPDGDPVAVQCILTKKQ